MANIQVLNQETINKIAAGEVIERPSSVVKELLENAVDAKATAITVEIREGGLKLIRVTDNGFGIPKEEIPLAFLRHSTSKIKSVEDLLTVSSLGFRGEALSSIAAVAQVELITKTPDSLTGSRYVIEGGRESSLEEIGAPEGTTFLVRNLFYNTPARRKFLKTAMTEGSYISELMERMALSHPDISFRFIHNNQNKLHTAGNHNLKDIIYTVFGREVTTQLNEVHASNQMFSLSGFLGKPSVSRGNRSFEIYFINGRYIRSRLIQKALEDAYQPFLMQHKYPFCVLHLSIEPELLDVNVHPTKMELRFRNQEEIYRFLVDEITKGLTQKELIPEVTLTEKPEKPPVKKTAEEKKYPEPFEKTRLLRETAAYHVKPISPVQPAPAPGPIAPVQTASVRKTPVQTTPAPLIPDTPVVQDRGEQLELFEEKILQKETRKEFHIIGQLFGTYWLIQWKDKFLMIDQHAAHEKVLYETLMKQREEALVTSQQRNPPIILTLDSKTEPLFLKYREEFISMGFDISHFGGKEYAVYAVPANLPGLNSRDLFMELLDGLSEELGGAPSRMVQEKIASMSCKAAVKGNQELSRQETEALLTALLELENPYTCPHGRPTMISMSRYEIEKKFKRIV